MTPALQQALQRLLVIGAIGALTAVGVNLTLLNGALPNAVYLIPVITAAITSILKLLGGATIVVSNSGLKVGNYGLKGPSFWSV